MSNPRFEELDDDDPVEMDLPEFGGSSSSSILPPNDRPQPASGGMPKSADASFKPHMITQQDLEQFKNWLCVYPIYFDASRSYKEGRRVPLKYAVKNPLAHQLAEATTSLNVQSIFEVSIPCSGIRADFNLQPQKTHPKDWANPGRIRVSLQAEAGGKSFKTKRALYLAMSTYLQSHPATPKTPLKVRIAGITADEPPPAPDVPKGWKMNSILPIHSPALTGGGVSDNLMRDLMREEGMAEPSGATKKRSKKK